MTVQADITIGWKNVTPTNMFIKIKRYFFNILRESEIKRVKQKYAFYFMVARHPSFELLMELQRLENEEIEKINEKYKVG
jgi:hypothetical protein